MVSRQIYEALVTRGLDMSIEQLATTGQSRTPQQVLLRVSLQWLRWHPMLFQL